MKTKIEKVMLIDDTEIDLYITSSMMEASGFSGSIMTRTSAEEALTYLQVNADNPMQLPDVIFLDIRMPVMDGFEFLENYDKLPETIKSSCIIYMLSSSLDYDDLAKAKCNPHVASFINKPLYPDTLDRIKLQVLENQY
jgi:CheY-like chemotaxis protein